MNKLAMVHSVTRNTTVFTGCLLLLLLSISVSAQTLKRGEYINWIPADVGYYSDKYRACLAMSLKQKGFFTEKIFNDCRQSCTTACLSENQHAIEKFHTDNNLFNSMQLCLNFIKTTDKYSKVEIKYQKKKIKNKKRADEYLARKLEIWCGDPKNNGSKGFYRARNFGSNKFGFLGDTVMLEMGIRDKCRITACADDRIYAPTQPSKNLNDRLENIESILEDIK